MAKTIIGRNLPLYKGEYSTATVYDRFDVVLYDGSSYVSKLPNNQNKPVTNTTYWQLLAQRGEFTEQQLEDFKAEVVAESKEEMDDYTDDKKAELDTYEGTKEAELNTYATGLKNDFDSNASSKTTTFNENATEKTTEFNNNASSKTETFDTNASTKTTAFDNNATSKTTAFNTNATNKTTDFNDNATAKTTDFNTNASDKTDDFNDNATDKTNAFDEHAEAKTDEFDEHTAEMQQEIDELSANMPWDKTEQATGINITNAAKYSRNKLELFGNTEQTQYTGKNLYDYENSTNTQTYNTNAVKESNGFRGGWGYRINLSQPIAAGTYTFSFKVDGDDNSERASIKLLDENKATILNTSQNAHRSGNISFTTTQDIYYIQVDNGNSTNTVLIYDIQIEEGSTATDYESYVGGQPSPSPDYPQDIHVVTGNNTARVTGKNLLDTATSTNGYIDDNGIPHETENNLLSDYISVQGENQYTISLNNIFSNIGYAYYDKNKNFVSRSGGNYDKKVLKITVPAGIKYIKIWFKLNSNTKLTPINILQYEPMFEKNSTATSYVPYHHADYPINLGSLELCKIGDYQDEFVKDNGVWKIPNKIVKIDSYNGETITTPYISTTGGLDIGATIYYVGNTEYTITDTTLISQLDAIYEHLKLVKGTNNITVTASDLAPYMQLSYMQDLPTKLNNLASRIELLEE